MTRHGSSLGDDSLAPCSRCQALELEGDSLLAQFEDLRSGVVEITTAGAETLRDVSMVGPTLPGVPRNLRGQKRVVLLTLLSIYFLHFLSRASRICTPFFFMVYVIVTPSFCDLPLLILHSAAFPYLFCLCVILPIFWGAWDYLLVGTLPSFSLAYQFPSSSRG